MSRGYQMDLDWKFIEISTEYPMDFHCNFNTFSTGFPMFFHSYYIENLTEFSTGFPMISIRIIEISTWISIGISLKFQLDFKLVTFAFH